MTPLIGNKHTEANFPLVEAQVVQGLVTVISPWHTVLLWSSSPWQTILARSFWGISGFSSKAWRTSSTILRKGLSSVLRPRATPLAGFSQESSAVCHAGPNKVRTRYSSRSSRFCLCRFSSWTWDSLLRAQISAHQNASTAEFSFLLKWGKGHQLSFQDHQSPELSSSLNGKNPLSSLDGSLIRRYSENKMEIFNWIFHEGG